MGSYGFVAIGKGEGISEWKIIKENSVRCQGRSEFDRSFRSVLLKWIDRIFAKLDRQAKDSRL